MQRGSEGYRSQELEAKVIRLNRKMSTAQRLEIVGFLNHVVQTEAMEMLRVRFPAASEKDLKRRMADLMHPNIPDILVKAFGPLPESVSDPVDRNPFEPRRYAMPEDYILCSLDWQKRGKYRDTNHWEIIKPLIQIPGYRLDIEYLQQWAHELSVSDLLERALEEARG